MAEKPHHPKLVVAFEARSVEEAEVVRSVLEGAGIPVLMPPDVSSLGDAQAMPWKLQEQTTELLYVPEDRLEEARRLIEERHREVDDPGFDVGGEGG